MIKSPHHIVGVQLLCQCSLLYIGEASPVTALSRIFCPALHFFKMRIYIGYKITARKNVLSENRIIWFSLTNILFLKIKHKKNIEYYKRFKSFLYFTCFISRNYYNPNIILSQIFGDI